MRSGAGAYQLRTHGGRVPVPWLIGTSGWAMFIHQPFSAFDLTGPEGRFTPAVPGAPATPGAAGAPAPAVTPDALPLDIFIVASRELAAVMAEWARLTGLPELPPLWTLGYRQSHRTLASRDEVVGIAKTVREKRLPCDALTYLGTGFTNSGWNVANGTMSFNRRAPCRRHHAKSPSKDAN